MSERTYLKVDPSTLIAKKEAITGDWPTTPPEAGESEAVLRSYAGAATFGAVHPNWPPAGAYHAGPVRLDDVPDRSGDHGAGAPQGGGVPAGGGAQSSDGTPPGGGMPGGLPAGKPEMPKLPTDPSVKPAAAGAGSGRGAGGGMPMAAGAGQNQGKEKRRRPTLSPDEDLYKEDRPWIEGVIGNRRRKDVQEGNESK